MSEPGAGVEPLRLLEGAGVTDGDLMHVRRQTFSLRCNWKVFCDNYLDGGYHVPVAHPDLASGLDLDAYTSTVFPHCSVQSCTPDGDERLGLRPVAYAFLFPNVMINRYGYALVCVLSPCCLSAYTWYRLKLTGENCIGAAAGAPYCQFVH